MTGGPVSLATAPFNPASAHAGAWRSTDKVTWTRTWQQGRITWLGAADWHKLAITQPRVLSRWWQGVIDGAGVQRDQDVTWLAPEDMPLPNRRLAICAQGVKGEAVFPATGTDVDVATACRAHRRPMYRRLAASTRLADGLNPPGVCLRRP